MDEKKYKILVVDDSEACRKAIIKDLSPLKPQFFESPDGRHALVSALKINPDLITLDIQMPKMDGFEACRQLRTNKTTSDIPIIMVTSRASREDLEKGFEVGAGEYFLKPFAKGELLKYVSRIFSGLRAEKFGKAILGSIDKETISIMRQTMEKNGFLLMEFENATELLGSINDEVDIIILDEGIKGLNALELTNLIRTQKGFEHIPIVYIPDKTDPLKLVKALDMGANDYLQKPFWDRELIARINTLVKSKHLFDQLQAQKKILENLAMTDKLTGLYNRHFLDEVMGQEFSNSVRHHQPLSFSIMDVDHFKRFNDKYGHLNGDAVLRDLGKLIQNHFRAGDIKARYGGEEFVVLMPNTTVDMALTKMEKFRQLVEKNSTPSTCKKFDLQFTVSAGIACNTQKIGCKEDLIKLADECLYQSKEKGRNAITVYKDGES